MFSTVLPQAEQRVKRRPRNACHLHELRACVSNAIIAFGRSLLFFLSLFVFALAARKRTTEKWGSTIVLGAPPQDHTLGVTIVDFLQHLVGQEQAIDPPAALARRLLWAVAEVFIVGFQKAVI